MPKLKTKSAAKKRFSFTATGKVKATQANKQHKMRNRSAQTLRDGRGMTILCAEEARRVKKMMPNG